MPTECRIPQNKVWISIDQRNNVHSLHFGGDCLTLDEKIREADNAIAYFTVLRDWLEEQIERMADD